MSPIYLSGSIYSLCCIEYAAELKSVCYWFDWWRNQIIHSNPSLSLLGLSGCFPRFIEHCLRLSSIPLEIMKNSCSLVGIHLRFLCISRDSLGFLFVGMPRNSYVLCGLPENRRELFVFPKDSRDSLEILASLSLSARARWNRYPILWDSHISSRLFELSWHSTWIDWPSFIPSDGNEI